MGGDDLLCAHITCFFCLTVGVVVCGQDFCPWVHQKPQSITLPSYHHSVQIKLETHVSVIERRFELVAGRVPEVKDVFSHGGHVAGEGAEGNESSRDRIALSVFQVGRVEAYLSYLRVCNIIYYFSN